VHAELAAVETTGTAARRWAELLDGWAIPDEILYSAPESPWGFDPDLFQAPERPDDTPSRQLALEALPEGGTVLDVGCGGGTAGLALVPPAERLVGVDESPAMLTRFMAACRARDVHGEAVEGSWPEVARRVHRADVVVCHHVLYNVRDVVAFVVALTGRARRRVVVEIAAQHPLRRMAPLWQHFWKLDRPDGPTAGDFLAVLAETTIRAKVEQFTGARRHGRSFEDEVRLARRRLCLPPERDAEVAEQLRGLPEAGGDVWTFSWSGDG
jgi:SAM-dependent methyltransferase